MSLEQRRSAHIEAIGAIFAREDWSPTDLADYVIERESQAVAGASRMFQASLGPAMQEVQLKTIGALRTTIGEALEDPFADSPKVVWAALDAMERSIKGDLDDAETS